MSSSNPLDFHFWQWLNEEASNQKSPIKVSFEFFPVNSRSKVAVFKKDLRKLANLNPEFASVTYGALNGNRSATQSTIQLIQSETQIPVAAHLTCADHNEQEIERIAQNYWDNGVRHIVALRGDSVGHKNSRFAADLVSQLKSIADFKVSVAAYPEVHPEAPSKQYDLDNLKRKLDAGASQAITQFFFDPKVYLNFLNEVERANIKAKIIPGILPVHSFEQVAKFAAKTNVSIPRWMKNYYHGLGDDASTRKMLSLCLTLEQLKLLIREGVEQFHFYTLNRSSVVYSLCCALGKRPQELAA